MKQRLRQFTAHLSTIVAVTGLVVGLAAGFRPAFTSAQNVTISSAQNCDSNAVIWCGAGSVNQLIDRVNNGDGHNTAASIQHIYSFFGISKADINSMNDANVHVEAGSVTKAGRVLDGSGNEIASAAMTGGRKCKANDSTSNLGGTPHEVSGTPFCTRDPSVSFLDPSLKAFIVMHNGQFAFAILASCGNPVTATPKPKPAPQPQPQPKAQHIPAPVQAPPPQPSQTNICNGNTTNANTGIASQGGNCSTNTTVVQVQTPPPTPAPQPTPSQMPSFTINKLVAPAGSTDFQKSVNAQVGSQVTFQVVITNNGTVDLTNVTVTDQLPSGLTFVAGSLSQTGINNGAGADITSGLTIPSMPAGSTVTFTFNATVTSSGASVTTASATNDGSDTSSTQCVPQTLTNTASASTPSLPQQSSMASVNETCVPPATTTPTTPPPATPAATPAQPAATPAAAPALVNTGPGSTIGLFTATASAGWLGYRWWLKRTLA